MVNIAVTKVMSVAMAARDAVRARQAVVETLYVVQKRPRVAQIRNIVAQKDTRAVIVLMAVVRISQHAAVNTVAPSI